MKYRNYTTERFDPLNVKLFKEVESIYDKDYLDKVGRVIHTKGESYSKQVFLGYYSSTINALEAIMRDLLFNDVEDIKGLTEAFETFRKELLTIAKENK